MKRITNASGAFPYLLAVVLFAFATLSGCSRNPDEGRLYAKLIANFEARGLSCALTDEQVTEKVPIWEPSAWRVLNVNDERVLVYFDESNRADYLTDEYTGAETGHISHFGLRFVLCYQGTEQNVIDAMDVMQSESIKAQ